MRYRMRIVRYGWLGTLEVHLLPWREILVKLSVRKPTNWFAAHRDASNQQTAHPPKSMGNSESFRIELETNGNGTKTATEVERAMIDDDVHTQTLTPLGKPCG